MEKTAHSFFQSLKLWDEYLSVNDEIEDNFPETKMKCIVQDMTLLIILPSSNECKSLFNTCHFYCSESIYLVNKSFTVL